MKKAFFIIFLISCLSIAQTDSGICLAVHGGAGTITKSSLTAEEETAIKETLKEALLVGYKILINKGSSLDAVEAAIKVLEDSPLFNAGKGAVFNNKGKNELDAAIMDGRNLKAGAVCGVQHIKNPISLARLVMEKSQHVLLAGNGAEEFAVSNGVRLVPEEYFFTQKRYEQLKKIQDSEKKDSIPKYNSIEKDFKFGTVGSVALDSRGNLAAGTSTGGMTNKKYGRIGDSPIIGAGTYANNNTCAISCTGHGEFFIRNVVAYDISAKMEYSDLSLNQAAEEVIHKKLAALGAKGGLIAIDKFGNVAMPFNTEGMYRGVIKSDGTIEIKIYKD